MVLYTFNVSNSLWSPFITATVLAIFDIVYTVYWVHIRSDEIIVSYLFRNTVYKISSIKNAEIAPWSSKKFLRLNFSNNLWSTIISGGHFNKKQQQEIVNLINEKIEQRREMGSES